MSTARNRPALSVLSEDYVRLVLALGLHDADYVDAYYGPPEWKAAVEQEHSGLEEIAARTAVLINSLRELSLADEDEMVMLRHHSLLRQSESLLVRVTMVQGLQRSFDEEARDLYDAVPPT